MKERRQTRATGGSREQRRHSIQRERRRLCWRRRGQRGQTLIIFALSLTVLMGLAGLSVDVSRVYDLYARMQRAAEAGALAGVLYLPNYYGTPLPSPGDGHTAISRASIEVVKNGFGSVINDNVSTDCPNPVTSVVIAVCQVTSPNNLNTLKVTITQTISVALLGGLGIGPTTISASGQAAYLPPIALGVNSSSASYFGDQGECNGSGGTVVNCNPTGGGSHVQNFMANINGPGDLKEQGDPYVYCEEGPSQGPPSNPADQNLSITPLPYTTYNGVGTNHVQYPDANTLGSLVTNHCGQPGAGGSPAGNPDQQPPGYVGQQTAGTNHPGAYNYFIQIPTSGASVWVYNPSFIPFIASSNNCHGKQALDTFYKPPNCANFYPNYGTLAFNGKFDDPSFYFSTTFSLYSVTATYFRDLDQSVILDNGGKSNTFRPYDQMTADLQYHGCTTSGSQVYDFQASNAHSSYSGISAIPGVGCITSPACQLQWCRLVGGLPAGMYRLAVESTTFSQQSGTSLLSGWGQHGYGVKICGPSLTTSNPGDAIGCQPGGNMSASPDMDIIFSFPSANAINTLAMGDVPQTYAGRSVTISLFDLCDSAVGNSCYAEVVPPGATSDTGTPNPAITVTYPTGVRTATDPCTSRNSIFGASNGDNIYNGQWLNMTVQLPPNYQGGIWQLNVCTSQGTAQDVMAFKISLLGSAIFLTPPS